MDSIGVLEKIKKSAALSYKTLSSNLGQRRRIRSTGTYRGNRKPLLLGVDNAKSCNKQEYPNLPDHPSTMPYRCHRDGWSTRQRIPIQLTAILSGARSAWSKDERA